MPPVSAASGIGGRVALAVGALGDAAEAGGARGREARGRRPPPPGPRPRRRSAAPRGGAPRRRASASGRWLTRKAPSATSKLKSSNGSCSASASRNSSVGYRRRASCTMPTARSTPMTSAPRAVAAAERCPGPQPTSRTRIAGLDSRRAAARSRPRSRGPSARRRSPHAPSSPRLEVLEAHISQGAAPGAHGGAAACARRPSSIAARSSAIRRCR